MVYSRLLVVSGNSRLIHPPSDLLLADLDPNIPSVRSRCKWLARGRDRRPMSTGSRSGAVPQYLWHYAPGRDCRSISTGPTTGGVATLFMFSYRRGTTRGQCQGRLPDLLILMPIVRVSDQRSVSWRRARTRGPLCSAAMEPAKGSNPPSPPPSLSY